MGLTLEQYLRVPYMVVVESLPRPDGDWVRRVSCPELGAVCSLEGLDTAALLDALDALRVRLLEERVRSGELPPVPRPPLSAPY